MANEPGILFFQLELGELPLAIEKELSVDPNNFLSINTLQLNTATRFYISILNPGLSAGIFVFL